MGEVKVAVGWRQQGLAVTVEDLGVEYGPANVEQLLPTLLPV